MSYENPNKIKSNVASIFGNMGTRVNITANGGSQQVTTNSNQTPSASGSDPSGSIPGNSPTVVDDNMNRGNFRGTGPMNKFEARRSQANSWEKDFGKTPKQQREDAAKGIKIRNERLKKQRDIDLGIVKVKQQDGPEELKFMPKTPYNEEGFIISREQGISNKEAKQQRQRIKKTYRASKNNKALIEKDDKIKVVNKNRAKRKSEKGWTETPLNFNNTMNYLDDNAQQQMDPNAAFQDPTNPMAIQPNRAGRPVNSNILTNDPNNYQDPNKVPASQNSTEQLFSNIASSDNNYASPFNQNDPPSDSTKIATPKPLDVKKLNEAMKIAISKKIESDIGSKIAKAAVKQPKRL